MNYDIGSYYQILGVKEGTSDTELKRAYRRKCKELHPVVNKSKNAHEEFLLLNEAYQFLSQKKVKTNQPVEKPDIEKWYQERRNRARHEASRYAQMKYEDFKKTDYYKNTEAMNVILESLQFFVSVFIFSIPFIAYAFKGAVGFWIGLIAIVITAPLWAITISKKMWYQPKELFGAIKIISKSKTFHTVLLVLFHLIVFFRITLNTQITFLGFLILISCLYGLAYLGYKRKIKPLYSFGNKKLFLVIIPLVFNLSFSVNYIFSSNPQIETYSFQHVMKKSGRLRRPVLEKTAHIVLPNQKYQKYYWYRVFFNFPKMENKTGIIYTFEDGLFGLRVLKKYEFID